MEKNYLSKIIASDNEGLQMISACCAGAKVKISEIKYLQESKVFLLSLRRSRVETEDDTKRVDSICKFEFVDNVKSKNIKQDDTEKKLELITIDYLKKNEKFEITLIFTNNAYITLSTEIIEVSLDDLNKII